MTRLIAHHIADIPIQWDTYTAQLKNCTNLNLFELACAALDLDPQKTKLLCHGKKVAVIPISSGEGYIEGFDLAVASIANHLGFDTYFVASDQNGFDTFHQQDFDIAIWADDDTYIAETKINGTKTIKTDNNQSTGKGFAQILHTMLKQSELLKQQNVTILVRGCGIIGEESSIHLGKLGHHVRLYDKDFAKAEKLANKLQQMNFSAEPIRTENLESILQETHALLDATPSPAQLDTFMWQNIPYVAAPCVPCQWKNTQTRWHDPLQLGTAVMLVASAVKINTQPNRSII